MFGTNGKAGLASVGSQLSFEKGAAELPSGESGSAEFLNH
jgi:hypothetical protein